MRPRNGWSPASATHEAHVPFPWTVRRFVRHAGCRSVGDRRTARGRNRKWPRMTDGGVPDDEAEPDPSDSLRTFGAVMQALRQRAGYRDARPGVVCGRNSKGPFRWHRTVCWRTSWPDGWSDSGCCSSSRRRRSVSSSKSRSSDAGSVIRTEVAVTEQAVCVRTPRTGPHCNTLADCRCPPVQLGGPGAGIGSARRLPGRLRRLIYAYDRHVSAADLTQGEGVA